MTNKIIKSLNLSGITCPLSFVKIKLTMEDLCVGDCLEVFLDDGEPILNVPRSLKKEGHKIIETKPNGTQFRLVVEKSN